MSSYGKGPRCPNHHVVLQKTNTPGVGICPISGYHFSYESDEAKREKKLKVTFSGIVETEEWNVESLDGQGG